MKRMFLAIVSLTILGMMPFSRAEKTSDVNPTVCLRNNGDITVTPVIIAQCTFADGSQNEVAVPTEPLLPGQESNTTLPVEASTENPIVSIALGTLINNSETISCSIVETDMVDTSKEQEISPESYLTNL
ncbi:hypothetical protein H0W26_05540 [Candidatus Dependentiae bacterium]|nr:hypothetical protein [Candidatus Dependentiae bacterium]